MASIFLSYSREDHSSADRLARVVEGAGHDVWWDQHLDSGEEFAAEIEAALEKAQVVLVCWSKLSVKSRWVRDEASVGGDTGRLVPVSIDGTLPPMGFRQFHTLDLTGWKGGKREGRTTELLHSIDRRLAAKGSSVAPTRISETKRRSALSGNLRKWIIAAFGLVLVAGAAAWLYSTTRNDRHGPIPKPTIALVSFTAPASDSKLGDVAAQARDSLSHTLSQTGIPVRLVSSVPQDRRSAGDFLLSGELTRNADKVIATVRLDEAIHGVTVFTRRFEASGGDVPNLPDRIGAQMADFFDGPQLLILDRRHPMDPQLMAELLADPDDPLQSYQIYKRAAAKAPDDPNPWIGLAFFTGFVLGDLPRGERRQAVIDGRQAAERALQLAPEFGDTRATWCFLHSETRMAECEDELRAGKRIDPDAPYLNGFLAASMRDVGRFNDAADLSRLSYTHNPYNQFKIREMLRTLEFTGDDDEAQDLFEQGSRWWPQYKFTFFRNRLYGLLARGDLSAMERIEEEAGSTGLPPNYPQTRGIAEAVKARSAPALHRACANSQSFPLLDIRCMIAFATTGDLDAAYSIADRLFPRRVGSTPAETEKIWLDDPDPPPFEFVTSPAAAPMRRDPRFLALAERTGLLAYWRSGRPPDFCGKSPEPICKALLRRH